MSGGVITSLDAEECSALVWDLAYTKILRGEGMKETLIWAIRNRAWLPDDPESREWIADVLEGKLDPERGRGRPRKKQPRDIFRAIIERGIVEVYEKWLAAFQSDRELAWLRFEAKRIRQEQPDAAVWRRLNDFGTEEGRRSFERALATLGACPCPPAARGAETARELALRATVQERGEAWKSRTGNPLTPPGVARLVTHARKSK
jgi:hypothetical protein